MKIAIVCFISLITGLNCQTSDVVAFTKGRITHAQLDHGETMSYDKTITNFNSLFSNEKFICQVAGVYAFHFYAVTKSNEHVWLEMYRNDEYIVSIYGRTPSDYVDAGNTVILQLNVGDEVYIKAHDEYSNVMYGAVDQIYNTFTGFRFAENYKEGFAAFSVGLTNSVSLTAGQHVLYDRIITDTDNDYDSSTGNFIAPATGIYIFHYHALATSNHEVWLDLYLNDQYVNSAYGKTPNEYADAGNSVILHLHNGDKVSVRSRRAGGIYGNIGTNQTYTTFSGSMLSQTTTDFTDQIDEVAFSVGLSAHHTTSNGHIVIFDKVFINHGLGYDTKTGKFTAKYSGIYVFHFHALSHSDKPIWIDLYHNFKYVDSIYGHVPSGYVTGSNSATIELLQGDEVFLDIKSHDTALYGQQNQIYCTFSGYLLAPVAQYNPIIG